MSTATRVVVSYPADLSGWGRQQLETTHFRGYLCRVHEEVTEGDVWEEFLDVGCCGDSLDVPLRVEEADGGVVDEETDIDYVEREACGLNGGWQVQSEAGPTAGNGR